MLLKPVSEKKCLTYFSLFFLAIEASFQSLKKIRKFTSRTRRIPDVTITEFWGVRVIIEGRIFEARATENSLASDARKRIEEGWEYVHDKDDVSIYRKRK